MGKLLVIKYKKRVLGIGDFYYLGYCVGNVGGTIEEQINGAFDHTEYRLNLVGLCLLGHMRIWLE